MHTFHMKKLIFLFFFIPIFSVAQGYEKTNNIEVFSNSEEEIFVEGIYDLSKKVNELPAAISILPSSRYINISPTHLSEALNGISGVNIHRGSGQEHLTSIRSPVLTGGSGAGSFLYMEDGVPLRAAGFSNVNGLFEQLLLAEPFLIRLLRSFFAIVWEYFCWSTNQVSTLVCKASLTFGHFIPGATERIIGKKFNDIPRSEELVTNGELTRVTRCS